MFKDMQPFVSSEICLSCDGCCRFKESKSVWRPRIFPGELALANNTCHPARLGLRPCRGRANGGVGVLPYLPVVMPRASGDPKGRPLTGKSDLSKIYSKETMEAGGSIKTVQHDGSTQHFCSFFTVDTNACRIYEFRPLECRLYPFVLTKKDGKTAVSVHLHCPFVQEKGSTSEFHRYVEYLKKLFARKDVLAFVQENPSLAGDYPGHENELEYLFAIG